MAAPLGNKVSTFTQVLKLGARFAAACAANRSLTVAAQNRARASALTEPRPL